MWFFVSFFFFFWMKRGVWTCHISWRAITKTIQLLSIILWSDTNTLTIKPHSIVVNLRCDWLYWISKVWREKKCNIYIYIYIYVCMYVCMYKLKHNIYYCYVLVESHQHSHHYPISYSNFSINFFNIYSVF